MTAQMHENLILDGDETSMAFCPPLPKNDSRIVYLKDDNSYTSTACWREYIGTWEVKNNKFYLVSLEGRYKLLSNTPIFSDWFSGTLRIPQGELLHYVHMGFGSVYEQEVHIKIKKGIVTKSTTIDNRNKHFNTRILGWKNLPGFENRFDGDKKL